MKNEKMIEIRNLTKTYPNGFTALRDVSFEIGRGEIVGYLGPNGAGKTTTIKVLTDLIRPTEGKVRVAGIDVNRQPKKALKHIGALIEVPGIYGYLTPRELLRYFGRVHGMDRRTIERKTSEVMERVSLDDWIDKKISGFSTGMQRRFAIAKAMLHEPELLILDEPVLGLDPQGIIDIRNMIRSLSKEGMTIFLSSHLLPEVSETCEKVIFINKGKILKIENVSEIIANCRSSIFEVELRRKIDRMKMDKLRKLDHVRGFDTSDGKLRIDCSGGHEKGYELLSELVSSGFEPISFIPERTNLENYYLDTIRVSKGVA
jgi:ABC-2 type transport system ATP-binding protein